MHTRLPSFTFTSEPMYAQTNWAVQAATSTVFYQGSTMQLDLMLEADGQPLDTSEFRLQFILKKALEAENILYQTDLFQRPPNTPLGYFRVQLPKAVSDYLKPGVYYYAVEATRKATGAISPPFRGTFCVELSAASPHTQLDIQDGEPTALGPGGTADERRTPAELTGPTTPDIGRRF